jgi:hypothetical protein
MSSLEGRRLEPLPKPSLASVTFWCDIAVVALKEAQWALPYPLRERRPRGTLTAHAVLKASGPNVAILADAITF